MNRLWRFGHYLFLKDGVFKKAARIIELLNHIICANSVSIAAQIDKSTVFYHRGIGCVVHPNAIIGEKCKIFQGVTLGSKWSKGVCQGEAPQIGNNVMIGAGAVILGDICIGDNAIIGANAVVVSDVPANCCALGVPAKIQKIMKEF